MFTVGNISLFSRTWLIFFFLHLIWNNCLCRLLSHQWLKQFSSLLGSFCTEHTIFKKKSRFAVAHQTYLLYLVRKKIVYITAKHLIHSTSNKSELSIYLNCETFGRWCKWNSKKQKSMIKYIFPEESGNE